MDPPPDPPTVHPLVALGLSALALGTGSIFIRLADAPAPAVAFWRCALAAAVLGALAGRGALRELAACAPRERASTLLSGLFLAIHFATWIESLERTSVASSVLFVSTAPVWVGLLTPIWTSDRIARLTALGIAASVAGSGLLAVADLNRGRWALSGDALALAGGWAMALHLVAGRRARGALSLRSYAAVCYGSAAALLALSALARGVALTGFAPRTWLWIGACALVPQLVGHTTFNWALRWSSAALVSVALSGEPVVATLLAWAVLGEEPTAYVLAGGPLILVGIAAVTRGESRARDALRAGQS